MNRWRSAIPYVLVVSLLLNVAFVVAWLVSGTLGKVDRRADTGIVTSPRGVVWCPLHRKLGVTSDQWKALEPKLEEFRAAARTVCDDVTRARLELIEMLAGGIADRAAIQARQEAILAGQRKMQDLSIAHLLGEKRILTPAQQRDLFAMIREQSRCVSHGPFRGFGGGSGQPFCEAESTTASGTHR